MSEFEEQKALCRWLDAKRLSYFAVPNENLMSSHNRKTAAIQGAKLKQAGKKKGAPDLQVHLKNIVLFIEMKRTVQKGKSKPVVSIEQKAWIERLNNLGHPAKVCYGWQEAKEFVESVLRESNALGNSGNNKVIEGAGS